MNLKTLFLYQFRNFYEIDFKKFKKINLFSGKNGSGKTSLLEALGVLCTGKSFRSASNEVLIAYGHSSFTLHGECLKHGESIEFGLKYERKRGLKLSKNIDHHFKNGTQFLRHPARLFTPENIYLFTQGPSARLNFLNWGCYYLYPEFKPTWQQFLKLLEHRRVLLKSIERYEELKIWNEKICELNEIITKVRQAYFDELKDYWQLNLKYYFPKYVTDFSLFSGWDTSKNYEDQLAESFSIDKRYHSTRIGSHRADLKATIRDVPIAQMLSRGEMKTLVLILGALQLKLFSEKSKKIPWLLIDEFDAELDSFNLDNILKVLDSNPSQVFLTSQEFDFNKNWAIYKL